MSIKTNKQKHEKEVEKLKKKYYKYKHQLTIKEINYIEMIISDEILGEE